MLPLVLIVVVPVAVVGWKLGEWESMAFVIALSVAVLVVNRLAWRRGGYKRNWFERRFGALPD